MPSYTEEKRKKIKKIKKIGNKKEKENRA